MATTIPIPSNWPDLSMRDPEYTNTAISFIETLNDATLPALNVAIQEVEDNTNAAEAAADIAANGAAIVQAVSNYAGTWSELTGALNKDVTVIHDSGIWWLKVDLPDVTASEPGVSNSDYQLIMGASGSETFTAYGMFTKKPGARVYHIKARGAGAGGGNDTGASSRTGGGGGTFAERLILASELDETTPATPGAGGLGMSHGSSGNGADGGDSTFGTWLTARGGFGNGDAGDGGVYYSGITHNGYASGSGGFGAGGDSVMGGAGGGGSANGAGGISQNGGDGGAGNDTSNQRAEDGEFPGGGGGGSSNNGGGGDGANGKIEVLWW